MKYIAFISYRHLPPDSAIAEKLIKDIEQFVIPKSLRKNGLKKPGKVFRDKEELPLSSNLKDSLYSALDESQYLIMICSPDLLKSKYCMEELRYFLTKHSLDHVLTVLVRGTPEESFPPALLTETHPETGIISNIEPLAADVSGPSLRVNLKKLKTEKLRILAACLGCAFDDLVQRSRRRRRKKIALISTSITIAAIIFALVLAHVIHSRNEEQRSRMHADAQLLVQSSEILAKDGNHLEAIQNALEAYALEEQGNFSLEGQDYRALANAAWVYETDVILQDRVIEHDQIISKVTITPEGKYLLIDNADGQRVRYEIETGKTEEGDFSGYYTSDGLYRITCKDGNIQVMRADDGTILHTHGEDVYQFIVDEDSDTFLICQNDTHELCRLSTGDTLAKAVCEESYTADAISVTGDEKAAAVLLHAEQNQVQQFQKDLAGIERKAIVQILTGSAASMLYELPDPGRGALISTSQSLIYVCPTGMYLIDPEDTYSDFPYNEPYEIMHFSDYDMDLSHHYIKTGKKNLLIFGTRFLLAMDRDTGLIINALTFDDYSPVISCSWIDEEETHAVFVTSTGNCYHYYDEHQGLAATELDGFVTHQYDGGRITGVSRQQPLLSLPDLACSSRDGTGIFLATVTRENRQAIRLYQYYQNSQADYLSLNEYNRGELYTLQIPGGHLIRYEGTEDRVQYFTLLEYRDGKYTERAFSMREPLWGISADLNTVYSPYGMLDLETGTSAEIVSAEQKKKLNETFGELYSEALDSLNNNLRMFINEANNTISVIAMKNDQLLWEDVFPCEGTPFFDEAAPTIIGKNGWASTPVMKADGSIVWVLTDLYGHQFTTIPGPDYRNGMMGKNPQKPVYFQINEDQLCSIDCKTGEKTGEISLPIKSEEIRDIELLRNDQAAFLVQRDLTVYVIDLKNGSILYSRHVPFSGTYYGSMILHFYEGNGEFCYTFRNEGLAYMFAAENNDKAGYYTAAYNVDLNTWREKWIAPRLHSIQYDIQRMVVYDSTFTKCYSLPILTTEELVQTAEHRLHK